MFIRFNILDLISVIVFQCWLSFGSEILQVKSSIRKRSEAQTTMGGNGGRGECRAFLDMFTHYVRIYLACRDHLRVPVHQRVNGSCRLHGAFDNSSIVHLVQIVLECIEN